MDKIKICDLENSKDKLIHLDVETEISEINAIVKASLNIKSLGELINVKGHINGVIKLTCDRCLSDYDYNLDFDIDENYTKTSSFLDEKQEVEIKDGQFVTDLFGAEEIDIYDLLYQSVILELPNKKVCGINCNGDSFEKDESFEVHDSRMDIFKNIKIEK